MIIIIISQVATLFCGMEKYNSSELTARKCAESMVHKRTTKKNNNRTINRSK